MQITNNLNNFELINLNSINDLIILILRRS